MPRTSERGEGLPAAAESQLPLAPGLISPSSKNNRGRTPQYQGESAAAKSSSHPLETETLPSGESILAEYQARDASLAGALLRAKSWDEIKLHIAAHPGACTEPALLTLSQADQMRICHPVAVEIEARPTYPVLREMQQLLSPYFRGRIYVLLSLEIRAKVDAVYHQGQGGRL